MSSTKAALRLAEAIDGSWQADPQGADKLVSTIDELAKIAASSGCAELMAFATSAVRDAKTTPRRCSAGARRDRRGAAGAQRGRLNPG